MLSSTLLHVINVEHKSHKSIEFKAIKFSYKQTNVWRDSGSISIKGGQTNITKQMPKSYPLQNAKARQQGET